jgi:hypothetical protein
VEPSLTTPELSLHAAARRESSWKLMVWLLAFFLATTPLVISVTVTPAEIESGRVVLSPPCSIRRFTGHDCPTCGLSRAFAALGHGDVDAALGYHRAALVAYSLYGLVSLVAFAGSVRASLRLKAALRTEMYP